jgi:hypothetical protein
MKKLLSFIMLIGLLYSCKKDSTSTRIQEFAGTWEFQSYSGYPFTNTPLPRGNGRIIFIGVDKTFERRNFDTVLFRGKYELEEKKDCVGEAKKIFFKSLDPYFLENIISIENGKLNFTSSNCVSDVGINVYIRK